MPYDIDETHDPNLESWVESANDPATEFPIQNLPLCAYAGADEDDNLYLTAGVRIGDEMVDLLGLEELGLLSVPLLDESAESLPEVVFSLSGDARRALRQDLVRLLRADSDHRDEVRRSMVSIAELEEDERLGIIDSHDYTDFYASVYHATNVGSMFRPDNPLLPNYKWIPVGYHGRASSIVPSGVPIVRPSGQQAPAEEGGAPGFGPCKLLDYELELGVILGGGNALGESIPISEAEDHILGVCLLNDWSARDLQKWEYQPLGPFLAKNFATSISPYIVTMEALAPFRCGAMKRPDGDPQPLAHLLDPRDQEQGGIDITLEVYLASEQMRSQGMDAIRLSRGSFKDMYWTIAQMLTHHASSGCNMQPGDLLGSGTISGPTRDSRGCLLELTWDGDPFANPAKLVPGTQRTPIVLPTGEERKFLADGDEVIIRGFCERDGYRRIGFGECRGIIEPARL